jgi:hypothetical protein
MNLTDSLIVLEGAACIGADPNLFNATSGETAEDALSYCDRCDVRGGCDDLVKPRKSHYDGVAAGKVWKDGAPVEIGLFELREKE